ncbi:hypothetical protein GQ44DRAFT_779388 [Phaeosphaeriaceae sp. PMI808]|nr:hypothetical protein GQ44DRAFT_779388 [Phaeosphaeriaceae sp. PMI808]
MSKVLRELHDNIIETKSWKIFFQLQTPGGQVVNEKKKVNLQVNSQAKSTALKEYVSNKKGTHANVASAEIDINTPEDKQEEAVQNMLKTVTTQYKSKIG